MPRPRASGGPRAFEKVLRTSTAFASALDEFFAEMQAGRVSAGDAMTMRMIVQSFSAGEGTVSQSQAEPHTRTPTIVGSAKGGASA